MPGNLGPLVLFYLLKWAMAIGAGVLVVTVMCLTCCLAALPYVSAVVFLPVTVFFRSFSLCLLAQLGPQWSVFEVGEDPPEEPLPEVPYYDPSEFA